MLTVLQSLELSTDYLAKKGVESARTNAELLLSHILKCNRLDLYLRFNQPLNERETNTYREFIKRRGEFEPYQYIIGEVEFYGLKFFVDKNVLIPRQETEILIESILKHFTTDKDIKILDIGTGSGNIPITLAVNLPKSKIISVDISPEAISIAEKNRELHNLASQVGFINSDILTNNLEKYINTFDIIVSNPPYIDKNEIKNLQKEITGYEPKIALTDNDDGLKFYRTISEKAPNLLTENGMLFFEVGEGQSEDVAKIMNFNNFRDIKIEKDYLDIERVVSGVNSNRN